MCRRARKSKNGESSDSSGAADVSRVPPATSALLCVGCLSFFFEWLSDGTVASGQIPRFSDYKFANMYCMTTQYTF